MMIPGHFQLFTILVKLMILFHVFKRTHCDVVAMDTCAVKELGSNGHRGEILRADIPIQAGMEGIDLRNGNVYITDPDAARENQKNTTWSIKFYVKVGPPKTQAYAIFTYVEETLRLDHLDNDKFRLYYKLSDNDHNSAYSSIILDNPKEDFISKSATGDSDWVQLVGIKMKITNQEKRSTSSDNQYWKMFGIQYSKHPNEEGSMKAYVNGKLSGDSVIKTDEHLVLWKPLTISNGVFSCIQYHNREMGDEYFEGFSLNECKKQYEDKPKQKFLDCQNDLATKDSKGPIAFGPAKRSME